MRWIFFALVFANLLLLGVFWQQQTLAPQQVSGPIGVPDDSRRLQLVSELEQPLQALRLPAGRKSEVRPMCYVAGPYGDELDARHLLARAEALGLDGRINRVEVATEEPSEYWVHVPPRSSRAEAMRILKELQQRKIDSYIITQGDLAEGVSLGLFRNKTSAYGLQEKVDGFGIPVNVRVMHKSEQEYWVEIDQVSQLNDKMRERIRAGDANIGWQQVACGISAPANTK